MVTASEASAPQALTTATSALVHVIQVPCMWDSLVPWTR